MRVHFTARDWSDLATIAEHWGIPRASVIWAITASELASYRRRRSHLGKVGLAIAAAVRVLRNDRDEGARLAKAERLKSDGDSCAGGQ